MDNSNNLAEYILANYGKTIEASLIHYFKEHSLYADVDEFENPEKYQFNIDIHVTSYKHRYFKAPGDAVDFDIEINCIIEVTDLVGDELETSIFEDIYTLTFSALLSNGLNDLEVKNVRYGSHMRDFTYDDSLSEFLVPYVRTTDYEKYANEFLSLYYPEALSKPMQINPIELLERMHLSVFFAKLDEGVDGKIIFSDEYADVLIPDAKCFKKIKVKAGSILINTSVISKGKGCLNRVIIHECLHWWMHKKYFELQILLNPDDPSLRHYIDEMEMPDKKRFMNKYYMELQARTIAPIVMMPKDTASVYYETILAQLENRKSYHSKTKTFLYALYKFADKFGASTSCARNRLESLGYTEVSFASKIGNELKIRPFKSSVRLEHGQTYILEFAEAVKAFSKSPIAKLALSSGKILYVDGLFVINDEKYVKFFKKAKPKLTELALSDVSKCCILFDTKKEGVSIEFNPATFNFVTFCSDSTKTNYKTNPSISFGRCNEEILDLKRSSLHQREEIETARYYVSKMNQYDTFAEKLDCLLGEECMAFKSDRGIGGLCDIDGKTITAYRKGLSKPDEKKLLAMCAGLNWHPLISGVLFRANRMDFYAVSEEPYPFYLHLMTTCYNTDLATWNTLIREAYPDKQEYQL